jgi:galactofuranose transport system permease protein
MQAVAAELSGYAGKFRSFQSLLTGGVGFVPGTLMGVLMLGLIQQIIIFDGTLNSWWTKIVIGALLLIFIVLQKLISRRQPQAEG